MAWIDEVLLLKENHPPILTHKHPEILGWIVLLCWITCAGSSDEHEAGSRQLSALALCTPLCSGLPQASRNRDFDPPNESVVHDRCIDKLLLYFYELKFILRESNPLILALGPRQAGWSHLLDILLGPRECY